MTSAAQPDAVAHGVAALVDVWLRLPRIIRASVPIAGMVVLWWSSAQVPEPMPYSLVRALLHNAMHVAAYAALAASIWLAWSRRPASRSQAWRSRAAWLLATLYGVVDELHQSCVPGRVCSIADLLADASGAALAVVVLRGVVGVAARWQRRVALCLLAGLASVGLATFTNW